MGKHVPILFEHKAECCGCGACLNRCPQSAISMERDAHGFLYPKIDAALCVGCGLCKTVCSFTSRGMPQSERDSVVYAAASEDGKVLNRSSSGGIFAELANAVIAAGGVVYGAAWEKDLTVNHIRAEDSEGVRRLQGSKYVQSNTLRSFFDAKLQLESGKTVLFCGTPCQISGLYSYLGKNYENLYTVDLICHGVPNDTFLKADLQYLASDSHPVEAITFRDKSYGWGTVGSFTTSDGKKHRYSSLQSPYYYYFLDSAIYRDSCYHCRYPSEKRVGDITLGDYWGIESAHPDISSTLNLQKGVSCVLVNSQKGEELFALAGGRMRKIPSDLSKIRQRNGQLVNCCAEPAKRKQLLEIYQTCGYQGIVTYWKKHERKSRLLLRLKSYMPYRFKQMLKGVRKK